ncbi:MAG TPA: hypothetical protein PLU37_13600 [Chitinophagaceae bacterium]|nr:hypothetical protein [Chitinophagaceae bacterium]
MKLIQSLLITLLVVAVSCNKDKFTTTPQVKIKSISPGTVVSGAIITIEGKYTDQVGDVDTALIIRKYFNGTTETLVDTFERVPFSGLGLPAKTRQADFEILYEYNTQNTGLRIFSGVAKDTTAAIGIVFIDMKGNRSDYQETDKIRLIKPLLSFAIA